MSTNHTPNYNLNQWVKSDKVLMDDFNADNAKIDAAIASVERTAAGKASVAALDGLAGTVSGLNGALLKKGNCRVVLETYTGDGADGRAHTFSSKPLLVILYDSTSMILAAPGMGTLYKRVANASVSMSASWSGNSLIISAANPDTGLNTSGWSYHRLAFLDAET